MYTSYDFVIVSKVLVSKINRFGREYKTQTLQFKLPKQGKMYQLQVTNKIDISELKRGDKVKLHFNVFRRGRSYAPQFCVSGVLVI